MKIKPLIYGGGQQRGLRSGTENVPGIAGLGAAAREMYRDHQREGSSGCMRTQGLYDRAGWAMSRGLRSTALPGDESAPQIVSASFYGVRSEVLLHALEEKGIYVSSGSACSSNHPAVSGTLKGDRGEEGASGFHPEVQLRRV